MRPFLGKELFADDDTKDVEIEMLDGSILAHAAVLSIHSDALRGLLKHGVSQANAQKQLSWKEHTADVGRFLLQLIYTIATESDMEEKELQTLLGALEIANMYVIDWPMQKLVNAAKSRLKEETFDSICSTAINRDLTVLRLHCTEWAQREGKRCLIVGERVKAIKKIRWIEPPDAIVEAGSLGEIGRGPRWGMLIVWWLKDNSKYREHCAISILKKVANQVENVMAAERSGVRDKYNNSEVMSELASVWGPPTQSRKRRRSDAQPSLFFQEAIAFNSLSPGKKPLTLLQLSIFNAHLTHFDIRRLVYDQTLALAPHSPPQRTMSPLTIKLSHTFRRNGHPAALLPPELLTQKKQLVCRRGRDGHER